MQFVKEFFIAILDGFMSEFELFGYKLSFWKIFVFVAVASTLISMIKEIFYD